MKIIIGSDHGGYELKEEVINWLKDQKIDYEDFGTYTADAIDYGPIAKHVAEAVAQTKDQQRLGILICGTGIGMSMMANKVKGIRAAVAHNKFTATATRAHNNANILCLGARVLDSKTAVDAIDCWLKTPFEHGRHQKRIDYMTRFEQEIDG
ncbi:ribose 5-phosphate isomerase B [Amphibacillus jilinensis]|uniref:ribose 5-phosphate isomerase B n=1 Tax=Amphibacillus jilinensis TaxID=1216008 RepID=UPI00030FCB52|nr:ribose 5-phosphate isomerase B [Amphibacillus jilinensis]